MSRFANPSSKPTHSVKSAESVPASSTPVNLAQRLLSSTPNTPLPPIIEPSTTPEVNALNEQIYYLLALSLRTFVIPWWSKISPRDKTFLPQITIILRAVIQDVHRRTLRSDMTSLLTAQLPNLIRQHVSDYKNAHSKLGTSYATTPPATIEEIFHRLQPHIAISQQTPDEMTPGLDPVYMRTAVDFVIKSCLPPEDAKSDLERSIVREVLVGPVLGNALPKLTQPWFLQHLALTLLGPGGTSRDTAAKSTTSFTFNSLLIVVLQAIQTISTLCLNVLHLSQQCYQLAQTINSRPTTQSPKPQPEVSQGLATPVLSMIGELFDLNDTSAPNNHTAHAILDSISLISGLAEPFLDRLIPYVLETKIYTPLTVSKIVVSATNALFPESHNRYPGPPPAIPSSEEQKAIREELEARLKEIIPSPLWTTETPALLLDPFSSAFCNMHLLVLIFDAILLTLFPEMGLGNTSTPKNEVDSDGDFGSPGLGTPSESSMYGSPTSA